MSVNEPANGGKKKFGKLKVVLLSIVGVFVALAILGSIVGGNDDKPDAAPSPSPTASPTPEDTTAPEASPSAEASEQKSSQKPKPSEDPTETIKAAAGDVKVDVEIEDGRVTIGTDLVDPRGDDGSAAAKQAIKICEAAAALEGVTYVNVSEADGTSWILYGHPAVPEGECGEV